MRFVRDCIVALNAWLVLFEALIRWRNLRGVSWSYGTLLSFPTAALATIALWWRRTPNLLAFLLMFPLAFALQLLFSSKQQHTIDPRKRIQPGQLPDRIVEAVQIPLDDQYISALHLQPQQPLGAVCVLHGSGDHKGAYTWWLADALLKQNLAVLLIDLDGHGENPRTQAYPDILDDVSGSVAWLRQRYHKIGVLGISLGGCVAACAVSRGVQVDALAVLEAPPWLYYTKADVRREALALAQTRHLKLLNDITVEQLIQSWTTTPIRAKINTWDLIAALDLPHSIRTITVPTRLLYGGRDAIVKPSQLTMVQQAAAAAPHAHFELIPHASHLTLILDPDVQQNLAQWFAQEFSK